MQLANHTTFRLSALLSLCVSGLNGTAFCEPSHWLYPLEEGSSWTYEGTDRYQYEGGGKGVKTEHRRCQMVVLKRAETSSFQAAFVNGFPSKCSYAVILETPQGLFLKDDVGDEDSGRELIQDIESGQKVGDWFVKFPLRKGDRVDQENPSRPNNRYCWFNSGPIKTKFGDGWKIVYDTSPDTTLYEFVPGIGFVNYSYEHHGTVMESSVHLVRYHVTGR